MKKIKLLMQACVLLVSVSMFISCNIEPSTSTDTGEMPDYYYTGGVLGTTTVWGSKCFEQPTPAVENAGLGTSFLYGEQIFEGSFVSEMEGSAYPMSGVGPLSIRTSCIHCHPGYGHGKRLGDLGNDIMGFNTKTRETGNGYLLVIYGPGADGFGADEVITSGITGSTYTDAGEDDFYLSEVTGMPQTQSNAPFKAPINEDLIEIKWLTYVDEHDNKYADGTSYELIYPEVTIPESAFSYTSENLTAGNYMVKLEATIGIYGSGLLDAIEESDIDEEYANQIGEVWGGRRGADKAQPDGTTRKGRFTYGLTRGTLQYGPGANAIWNITNVTRESANNEHQSNYMTTFYAESAAADAELIEDIKEHSYYNFLVGETDEETSNKIYNYLMFNSTFGEYRYASRNDVDTETQFAAEMDLDDYIDLMVWHRGLAVPAARNVGTDEFDRGMELFTEMGCASCHRPSWTTGSDNYVGDADLVGQLPTYPNQTIWPYSDMLQHNLGMKNNIRTGWCRTTPLWGRSLNFTANGESSHLHDMRARTYEEAIMWHKGQGKYSSDKFRELDKDDRDAVVKFLQSI